MRLQDIAVGRKDLYMMKPEDLCEDPGWNVRLDSEGLDTHIRSLADSIKEIGVQEPLTVYLRDGKPFVTNGHCRLSAVRIAMEEGADIRSVPVRVEDRFSNDADRALSMITRNSGLPLTPLEKSTVVKRLSGYGWSKAEIANNAGFSPAYVDHLLTIAGLDPEIQRQIANGEISAASAVKAVQSMGPEIGKAAIGDVVEKAKSNGKNKATPKDFVRPAVVKLSEELDIPTDCLSERKGVFSIIVRELDRESVKDVVTAIREAGVDLV